MARKLILAIFKTMWGWRGVILTSGVCRLVLCNGILEAADTPPLSLLVEAGKLKGAFISVGRCGGFEMSICGQPCFDVGMGINLIFSVIVHLLMGLVRNFRND